MKQLLDHSGCEDGRSSPAFCFGPYYSAIMRHQFYQDIDWRSAATRHMHRSSAYVPRIARPALLTAKPELERREAETIALAGMPGKVTIATNMAGVLTAPVCFAIYARMLAAPCRLLCGHAK